MKIIQYVPPQPRTDQDHEDGVEEEGKNRRGKKEDQNNFWGVGMDMGWACRIIFFKGASMLSKYPKITPTLFFFFSDGRKISISGQMTTERKSKSEREARRLVAVMFVCAIVGAKETGRQPILDDLSKSVQLIL